MVEGTYVGLSSKCYGLNGQNIADNEGKLSKTGTKGINKQFTSKISLTVENS